MTLSACPQKGSFLRLRAAFSLVELLAAVAVMAIVAGLLIPAVSRGIAKAREAETSSNLRQIGVAINLYAADHDGMLPGPTCASIYNYGRATVRSGDLPHLGGYIAMYLSPVLSSVEISNTVSVLRCPVLLPKGRRDPQCPNWVKCDYDPSSPNNIFGQPCGAASMTMSGASQLTLQPKRLSALTSLQLRSAVICTADLQSDNNSAFTSELPPQGPFDGKRMWLFLDGSQALTNAIGVWQR